MTYNTNLNPSINEGNFADYQQLAGETLKRKKITPNKDGMIDQNQLARVFDYSEDPKQREDYINYALVGISNLVNPNFKRSGLISAEKDLPKIMYNIDHFAEDDNDGDKKISPNEIIDYLDGMAFEYSCKLIDNSKLDYDDKESLKKLMQSGKVSASGKSKSFVMDGKNYNTSGSADLTKSLTGDHDVQEKNAFLAERIDKLKQTLRSHNISEEDSKNAVDAFLWTANNEASIPFLKSISSDGKEVTFSSDTIKQKSYNVDKNANIVDSKSESILVNNNIYQHDYTFDISSKKFSLLDTSSKKIGSLQYIPIFKRSSGDEDFTTNKAEQVKALVESRPDLIERLEQNINSNGTVKSGLDSVLNDLHSEISEIYGLDSKKYPLKIEEESKGNKATIATFNRDTNELSIYKSSIKYIINTLKNEWLDDTEIHKNVISAIYQSIAHEDFHALQFMHLNKYGPLKNAPKVANQWYLNSKYYVSGENSIQLFGNLGYYEEQPIERDAHFVGNRVEESVKNYLTSK